MGERGVLPFPESNMPEGHPFFLEAIGLPRLNPLAGSMVEEKPTGRGRGADTSRFDGFRMRLVCVAVAGRGPAKALASAL